MSPDATDAPEVETGAGQPTLPGDVAADADTFTGSGAPPADGPEEDVSAPGAEPNVEEEPTVTGSGAPVAPSTFGGHGTPHVVQDNVSEPGVQKTTNLVDGSESRHQTVGGPADEREATLDSSD